MLIINRCEMEEQDSENINFVDFSCMYFELTSIKQTG